MRMKPRIETSHERKLVGKRLTMSLSENKTGELWKSFLSRHSAINNQLNNDLISMQVYQPSYFTDFEPTKEFEKWATSAVADFDNVPSDMETFLLASGLYAVFHYQGSSNDASVFQYIFRTWLPGSDYELDDRPHFEVLGDKYRNNDPRSEEEIWIPIKPRQAPQP